MSSFLLWCWGVTSAAQAAGGNPESVEGQMRMLWPIHFSSMPLSTPEKSSLESPKFGRDLTAIALEGFRRYVESVLPKELEVDKQFAQEFAESDHSRVNLAFLRWQKRVYAERMRVHPGTLTGRGDVTPRNPGIDYTWKEFYEDPIYNRLVHRLNQVSKLYLKRTGRANLPKKFRIFTWVEVYNFGDAQRPWARTDGAYLMGRYFAQARRGALKFNFEDPRGINPPFGKTYSHTAFEGNLIVFPTWVSHFITPNMQNSTQVCFGFLAYPPDGNSLDWEDDETGAVEVARILDIDKTGNKFKVRGD
jgi:hypothetical protein|mmetsp:Transcript_56560/g.89826  ORF Transcript_56560/g.89826 Transcript_56560/m.89826 type:complete len:305 (-) Transcript_56560:22-936(-)